MIGDLGYIINTHARYQTPLLHLVHSMQNVDADDIIVVVADGHTLTDATFYEYISDYVGQIYFVDHNSFDYTGAIELVNQRFNLPSHIAFLQDTMVFGEHTHRLFKNVNPEAQATAVYGGQCNLAVYRYDYLLGQTDFILEQHNITKEASIRFEGALWHKAIYKEHFSGSNLEVQGLSKPYGDTERIEEYYNAVDLTKYKANWGQNMRNLVTNP